MTANQSEGGHAFLLVSISGRTINTQPNLMRKNRYRAVVLLTLFAVAKKQGQSKIIKRVKE